MSVAKALTNYQIWCEILDKAKLSPFFFYGPELVLARYVASVLREELITPGMEDINYTRIDGQKATEAEIVQLSLRPCLELGGWWLSNSQPLLNHAMSQLRAMGSPT